jgi:signal transduction histidine kinase
MGRENEIGTYEDLAFFGKVNASISHELKNILAIISEAAGLLNDLTSLAKEGKDLHLEMLGNCSRDIGEEIRRGFATIKHMNRFSHSVDDPVKEVDLLETVDLMVAIAGFLSYACRVAVDRAAEERPSVVTFPFRLQHLIYEALVFAFKTVGPDGDIAIGIQPAEEGGGAIVLSGLGSADPQSFPSDQVRRLADSIGAEIDVGLDRDTISIRLPKSVSGTG